MARTTGYKMIQAGEARKHRELSIEQQNAIDLLVMGQTDRAVAEAVEVGRVAVSRWRLYDPHFRAELNRRRLEIWGASRDRLRSLVPRALDRLEEALDEYNGWRVALRLVELAGLSDSGKNGIGPTDPQELVKSEAWRLHQNRQAEIFGPTPQEVDAVWDDLLARAGDGA